MYKDKLQGKIKILGLGFILWSGCLFGQYKAEKPIELQAAVWNFSMGRMPFEFTPCWPSPFQLKVSWPSGGFLDKKLWDSKKRRYVETLPSTRNTSAVTLKTQILAIPANYYSSHLGIICQEEWKLEKKTGVPFRFRLGSLQYVDQLEGK